MLCCAAHQLGYPDVVQCRLHLLQDACVETLQRYGLLILRMQLQQRFACVMHLLLLLLRRELRDMVVQRIDERNVFEWIAWFQAEQLTFVFAAIFARAKGFATINNRNRENMLKVKWYKKQTN